MDLNWYHQRCQSKVAQPTRRYGMLVITISKDPVSHRCWPANQSIVRQKLGSQREERAVTYHRVYMSRTTTLSPAALTRGQKVSLSTSVTCPTAGTAVSKFDVATTAALRLRPEAVRGSPGDRPWGQPRNRLSEEGGWLPQEDDGDDVVDRIEGEERAIRSAIGDSRERERERGREGERERERALLWT